MTERTTSPAPPPERRRADVRVRQEVLPRSLILRTLLATVMIGAVLCFATYLIMRGRMRALRPSYQFPEQSLPAPHRIAGVRQELFRLAHPRASVRDAQGAALEQFRWVDRARGIVQIPIAVAIDLVARRNEDGGRSP